jgi:hypothetical protein
MTPAYLVKIGLVPASMTSQQAVINEQVQMLLQKIVFMPFGQADRRVALDSVLGRSEARELQRCVVSAAREVPEHRGAAARVAGRAE